MHEVVLARAAGGAAVRAAGARGGGTADPYLYRRNLSDSGKRSRRTALLVSCWSLPATTSQRRWIQGAQARGILTQLLPVLAARFLVIVRHNFGGGSRWILPEPQQLIRSSQYYRRNIASDVNAFAGFGRERICIRPQDPLDPAPAVVRDHPAKPSNSCKRRRRPPELC